MLGDEENTTMKLVSFLSPVSLESKNMLVNNRPSLMRLNSTGEEQKPHTKSIPTSSKHGIFHCLTQHKPSKQSTILDNKIKISPYVSTTSPNCEINFLNPYKYTSKDACMLRSRVLNTSSSFLGSYTMSSSKRTNSDLMSSGTNSALNKSDMAKLYVPKKSLTKINSLSALKLSSSAHFGLETQRTNDHDNKKLKCPTNTSQQSPSAIIYTQSSKISCKTKQICDNNCQSLVNSCQPKSLLVCVSAQCNGSGHPGQVNVQIVDKKDKHDYHNVVEPEVHKNQNVQKNIDNCNKKKKTRPSCKKRRRHQLQKDQQTCANNYSSNKSNCAFSLVMGWNSLPEKKSTSLDQSSKSSNSSDQCSSAKFSLFISGAELSDCSSESDDGFSEEECEDAWESFMNTADPFNLNFDIVCHLGSSKLNNDQLSMYDAEQKELTRANMNWKKLYGEVVLTHPKENKVHFAPSNKLESVDYISNFNEEYAQARLGPWEQIARDRERFHKRIKDVETAIGQCLTNSHRKKVFEKLYCHLTK